MKALTTDPTGSDLVAKAIKEEASFVQWNGLTYGRSFFGQALLHQLVHKRIVTSEDCAHVQRWRESDIGSATRRYLHEHDVVGSAPDLGVERDRVLHVIPERSAMILRVATRCVEVDMTSDALRAAGCG